MTRYPGGFVPPGVALLSGSTAMKTVSGLLSLAMVLAMSPHGAQARPLPHAKDKGAAAQARRAPNDGFAARMSRLDALMGIKPTAHTRSASADH